MTCLTRGRTCYAASALIATLLCLAALPACSGPGPAATRTPVPALARPSTLAPIPARPAGTVSGVLISEKNLGRQPGVPGTEVALNTSARGKIALVSQGQTLAVVATGSGGSFRVSVPAGRYQMRGQVPRCAAEPGSVTVRPGRATTGVVVYVACR